MSEEKKAAAAKYHRKALMSVADRLLVEYGYDGMNMNLLSKEAHYSKATVYVYFESKDEIVCSLAIERLKLLRGELSLVVKSDGTTEEKLKEVARVFTEFATDDKVYFNFVTTPPSSEINGMVELMSLTRDIFEELTAIVDREELINKWYGFYGKIKTEPMLKRTGIIEVEQ